MNSFRSFKTVVIIVSAAILLAAFGCGSSSEQSNAPTGAQTQTASASPDAAPSIGAISPSSGAGSSQSFRVPLTHPAGAAGVADVQIIIDEKLPGNTAQSAGACWIEINALKSVAVRTEDGAGFQKPAAIGALGDLSNKSCKVSAAGVKVETNGPETAITVPVTFTGMSKGPKKIWVIASGAKQATGWQQRGAWTVN